MYVIPLIVILLIALAIFFSPILAVIILAAFLVGLGLFKFFGPGTGAEHAPPDQGPAAGTQATTGKEELESDRGLWGEEWPEQRESHQEPSR